MRQAVVRKHYHYWLMIGGYLIIQNINVQGLNCFTTLFGTYCQTL